MSAARPSAAARGGPPGRPAARGLSDIELALRRFEARRPRPREVRALPNPPNALSAAVPGPPGQMSPPRARALFPVGTTASTPVEEVQVSTSERNGDEREVPEEDATDDATLVRTTTRVGMLSLVGSGEARDELHYDKVDTLAHLAFDVKIQTLLNRYHQIQESLATGERDVDLHRMAPLFHPMPGTDNVRLFAHHDIVRSVVEQFDQLRDTPSVFDTILDQFDDRFIRGAANHTGLFRYLSEPLTTHIEHRMWTQVDGAPPSTWRDFVRLPVSRGYRHVDATGQRTRFQTAPMNVWETTMLFFRIIEAYLHFEHGLTLSDVSLHYNAILVGAERHGASVVPSLPTTEAVESIPDALSDLHRHHTLDNSDVGMWHIVTLCVLHDTAKRIPDISFVFVLHSSDAHSRLQRTTGSRRAIELIELGGMEDELERLARGARPDPREPLRPAPHYHLVTIAREQLRDTLSQLSPVLPTYEHVLGGGIHVPLDPDAVNGFEQLSRNL